MLGPIRKFSSSIYAKIFLILVAIPFVFWGMGPVFQGGKQNTIVEIGKQKIPTQEFIQFVRYNNPEDKILDNSSIKNLLFTFIGQKLITQEIKNLKINVSDFSLSKIIKNEKIFMRDNKFSRTEYEKFLINKNLSAVSFETSVLNKVKKEQLFSFIGDGIIPPDFLINRTYNEINQERDIQVINLNNIFKRKMNFTEMQINEYFNKNKKNFSTINKSIKFKNLTPENLTGNIEYSDLFFKKLDDIDDLIVDGKNLEFILNQFDLNSPEISTFAELDINTKSNINANFPNPLIKKVFNIDDLEPTILAEHENKYFIIELFKTENIQKDLSDVIFKSEILGKLKHENKRKFLSELISKINKNNFKKIDFDKLSKDENIDIQKIKLENRNDNKIFDIELVNQIYSHGAKKVIVIADIGLSKSYLIYIENIKNSSIDKKSEDYDKYVNLSKVRMTSFLYNTYDTYLQSKYKININYKALDKVNNFFR